MDGWTETLKVHKLVLPDEVYTPEITVDSPLYKAAILFHFLHMGFVTI